VPKLFGEGFISIRDRYEYGLSLSPSGDEIFFTAEGGPEGSAKGLLVTRRSAEGIWSEPRVANLGGRGSWEFEAFHSPDGQSLLFTSEDEKGGYRIWRAERSGEGWGKPSLLDAPVNRSNVFWPSLSRDGTLYLTDIGKAVILSSEFRAGKYEEGRQILTRNTLHPSIAPDGSFILCNRAGGIYLSFRKADGSWSSLVDPGKEINTMNYEETCASLSPDGKFIFFSRYDDLKGKSNIYWVSAAIIESLRPKP
jgi:Tol biopolymer transport system component